MSSPLFKGICQMPSDRTLDLILSSLDRAHNKLDSLEKIHGEVSSHIAEEASLMQEQKRMNEILEKNTLSLELHIRRTELLEENMTKMEGRVNPIEKDFLHRKVINDFFSKFGKLVAILATVVGGVATLASKVFGLF